MTADQSPGATLRAGMAHSELTYSALWARYFSLGGMASPGQLRQIIDGTDPLSRRNYDLIAQAINEAFVDRGGDHPVPYADDVGL